MKHLIIDRPGLQSQRQRIVFGSLTLIFWALWIYLWLPVLALIGWILGFRIAYYQMVVLSGYAGLVQQLPFYVAMISGLGGSLLVWAYYNYIRFRGRQRRTQVRSVAAADLSRRYGIDAGVLDQWTSSRRLVMHHDKAGRVLGAEIEPGV